MARAKRIEVGYPLAEIDATAVVEVTGRFRPARGWDPGDSPDFDIVAIRDEDGRERPDLLAALTRKDEKEIIDRAWDKVADDDRAAEEAAADLACDLYMDRMRGLD